MEDIFKYSCSNCNYKCNSIGHWNQHLNTLKHSNNKLENNKLENNKLENNKSSYNYESCQCGKKFKHRQSLFKHKKYCNSLSNISGINSDIVLKILTDNQELRNLLIEQHKEHNQQIAQILPHVGNTINNNLSINIFLNEQCKDALNLTDFINSLQITMDDLDLTRINGLTKSVGTVIINGLRQLDITKRPIHCTDLKRETLYIKDQNLWQSNLSRMSDSINNIVLKHREKIKQWELTNPHWNEDDQLLETYISLVKELMNDIDARGENKIIKSIARETKLNKLNKLLK